MKFLPLMSIIFLAPIKISFRGMKWCLRNSEEEEIGGTDMHTWFF